MDFSQHIFIYSDGKGAEWTENILILTVEGSTLSSEVVWSVMSYLCVVVDGDNFIYFMMPNVLKVACDHLVWQATVCSALLLRTNTLNIYPVNSEICVEWIFQFFLAQQYPVVRHIHQTVSLLVAYFPTVQWSSVAVVVTRHQDHSNYRNISTLLLNCCKVEVDRTHDTWYHH